MYIIQLNFTVRTSNNSVLMDSV